MQWLLITVLINDYLFFSKKRQTQLIKIDYEQEISYVDVNDGEDAVETVVYDMFTIPKVMAKVPLTVTADTTVKEVVEILAKQTFHSLPVVENGNELVGIVTTTDLLNYFLEQYQVKAKGLKFFRLFLFYI